MYCGFNRIKYNIFNRILLYCDCLAHTRLILVPDLSIAYWQKKLVWLPIHQLDI